MNAETWTVVIAVITALGLRELLAKMIDRRATSAAVDATAASTAATEVETIRAVLAEVRANDQAKTERLTRVEAMLHQLEAEVRVLQERERHALTRAATHEAWDRMSFQLLQRIDPDHPAPPPLSGPLSDGSGPL